MSTIWHRISFLGIKGNDSLLRRENILANRINLVMLCVMVALNIVTATMRQIEGTQMGHGTFRLLLILAVNLINIWFASKRLFGLFKLSLIFLPVFIFFIFTSMVGFIEEESFLYYPYALIAFSIIPQLILDMKREKALYLFSLFFFLLLVAFIDNLLLFFSKQSYQILPIIQKVYVFYKIAPITIFMFIHISIFYLRGINIFFEQKVEATNEELKSALDELRVAQEQLIQTEKLASLGVLTAGVTHEINNPLNFIHGGIIGLERYLTNSGQLANKSVSTFVLAIKTGVSRITHIVKNLERYNRDSKLLKEPCEIHELLDECLLNLNASLLRKVEIRKNYSKNRIFIFGNIRELNHAFFNICTNACHAMSSEGTLTLTTVSLDTVVLIEICDTGHGIHPDNLSKIFDPFYTTKKPGEGTGLGIPIAYAIIKEHKGELHYHSELNIGTTVTVKLPVMEAQ